MKNLLVARKNQADPQIKNIMSINQANLSRIAKPYVEFFLK